MRKLLILVLLVLLGGLVFFLSVELTKKAIADTIVHFYTSVLSGDDTVFAALAPRLQDKEAIAAALQSYGSWEFGQVKEIQLTSLHRAQAIVLLSLEQKPILLATELVRHRGVWEIIALPDMAVLSPVFISETKKEKIILQEADGKEKSFTTKLALQPYSVGTGIVLEGSLIYFAAYEQVMLTKLLSLSAQILESENLGMHKLAETPVFLQEQDGKVQIVPPDNAVSGMENLTAFLRDGIIEALLLPADYRPQKIRALIKTNDFAHLLHQEIQLTATANFTLEDKIAQENYQFSPGQTLLFRPLEDAIAVTFPSGERKIFANRLHLFTTVEGSFKVENLRRGSPAFVPQYRGKFEISIYDQGLLLLNELPLETYLFSVVASEMPLSFGLEALKVQAVAARTYAVASVGRGSLLKYGAHVDDSVAFQVYNNVPENSVGIAAVNATQGIIVKYNDAPADTRFFSTSAGVTAASEEVWHDNETGEFPGIPVPYLTSRSQLRSGRLPAVQTEKGAKDFFTSTVWDGYDSLSPWFRWQVTFSRPQLEAVLTRTLPERWQAQPQFVLTQEQGQFISKAIPPDPIGTLLDLKVIRRGRGGNLMEIEIIGTNGTYRVLKEYTIRFTLRPQDLSGESALSLKRSDGSDLKNYAILPSAFCVFEIKRDGSGNIETIHFAGGGNGHGVGMSQWGARGLAASGHTFKQILEHYYPGCIIEKIY